MLEEPQREERRTWKGEEWRAFLVAEEGAAYKAQLCTNCVL